ncbi:hypothetical protein E0Z10_g1930 [Xylaria hypoxylon]|uniref:TPX2 C-terminal domain-containing protein n=1 Tax=Xylaria hypoxylon TaxID=37992 RepID=A0A4Z0YS16_9PEZI|nr:hypothetical protein E0Z10_g1930 [Xylaria hypoxylon]
MMSHKSLARGQNFEILCDSPLANNQPLPGHREPTPSQPGPLRHLSVSQGQNRQLEQVRLGTGVHELNPVSCNQQWGTIQKNSNKEKRVGGRLIRPSITANTFEVFDTAAKTELRTQSVPAASTVSDDAQEVLQLPVNRYSSHPLSIAAHSIPPLEVQLTKHRDGLFEWILAVRVSIDSKSQLDNSSGVNDSKEVRKMYFGCNLLPEPYPGNNGALKTAGPADSYLLLVTPVEETNDVLEVFRRPIGNSSMALPEVNSRHSTPAKISMYSPLRGADEMTPNSTLCTRGDDSFAESPNSGSLGDPVTRIEDSFEALDILEDQLEAFDKVARFNQFIPKEQSPSNIKPTATTELATPSQCVRFATPQPQHTFTRPSSASLRVKPASEPRRTALRKVTSMILDPYKFKAEEKTLGQRSPMLSSARGTIGSSPQTLVANSTKQRTIPTFELPGDVVARQLKEKKEARLASQRATQPTASSLRRARSAKLPTRPTFELPGEAISRRKREEHQAQLKTQEEEERKRREFKARPAPSHTVPATVPRETIASRTRQNKAALTENSAKTPTPNKRPLTAIGCHSRPALSSAINQPQPRGRELRAEGLSIQASRATSTSTTSASGQRSSLSIEDVQMQKLRGHEIYQRDNSWTDSRVREKYEREALAKLAREEAAERSRQKSREWAAKQAKKRITG